MRALGLVLLAALPATAHAASPGLAVGPFTEKGRGVSGHGEALSQALRYELSASGAFTLVADERAKRAALERIKKTNRHSTDERQWVRIGHAIGASHLLLGGVRRDRNRCVAFAQLVHLETRGTKVSRPEPYDCTQYDLVEVAGVLSAQLSGRRHSPPRDRAHHVPRAPVRITMEGDEAMVDGQRYTFHRAAPVPAPPAAAEPASPPGTPSDRAAPGTTSPAPPDPGPRANPSPAVDPLPAPPPAEEAYTVAALAQDVLRWSPTVTAAVLAVPLGFVLLFGLLLRWRRAPALTGLRFGLSLSVLALAAEAATYLVLEASDGPGLAARVDPLLLGAPGAAVALWLVAGFMLKVLSELRLFRQLKWLLILTVAFTAAILVADQLALPAAYVGGAGLLGWLGLRLTLAKRRRPDRAR